MRLMRFGAVPILVPAAHYVMFMTEVQNERSAGR